MQSLQNFIGPIIRIGQEIRCLPYARFFFNITNSLVFKISLNLV